MVGTEPVPRRRGIRYQELFNLRRNPFPDTAIAGADTVDVFDPEAHPGLPARMARVFLGPDLERAPRVTLLWSVGSGNEARGYGKSANLMWLSDMINADLGRDALRLAGAQEPAADRVVAIYTSFSTIDALSLSGALYAATRSFLARHGGLVSQLKDDWLANGRDAKALIGAGLSMANQAMEQVDLHLMFGPTLLGVGSWPDQLDRHRLWHRQRLGRPLFGALIAALKTLGITRVLLLIDQLEDFVDGSRPLGKHYRDFGRLAEICTVDPLFRDCLQVVMTMHPRAEFLTRTCWDEDKLGPFPSLQDQRRCVVIQGLKPQGLTRLVATYLRQSRVVPEESLRPFTPQAIDRLCVLAGGRPGLAIRVLHMALEDAIDEERPSIDVRHIERAAR
jgi:hypothetical protein